jgi:hypothetical protein
MEPYNIAYYLELQRQLAGAKGSRRGALAGDPKEMNVPGAQANPSQRIKVESTDLVLAILSFAALVTLGLACFLSPTFLTSH